MEPTAQDLEVERGAFRVDVCGHQFSVPTDQAAAAEVDQQLLQQLQPVNTRLRAQAAAATEVGISAIDALMQGRLTQSAAVLARLRRTRRRVSTALEAAEVPLPSEAASMFSENEWDPAAARGIVSAGMNVVVGTLRSGRPIGIECADVVDGVMSFELGTGSCAVLGVAACSVSDVDTPFASGVMESVVAAMNRHARRHPDVRHAWVIMLGPGRVRVCLVESDAMHVSESLSTDTPAGRRLLATAVANATLAESWRLGSDPTMKWCKDIQRWEILCPDSNGASRFVYARRDPVFAADSFFGRFTRCFLVSLNPDDEEYNYVLKDSWQLVSTELGDADLRDEVGVLRGMHAALEDAKCEAGVLQRLMCGGTVQVNDTPDSTRLVLGAELDAYARWTVAHGSKRTTAAHRLHRRMVSGPVGVALHELRSEQDAVAAVAGAMLAYDVILERTGILHRDISLGNILAVKLADGRIQGMLIDFDHAIPLDDERNTKKPGHVGTAPFMSIPNLEGLDVQRTCVDDWEAALALLLCLAARPSHRDALCARLASVGPNGVADFRREVFASRKSLDAAIDAFADPACTHALRLIRALHHALFAHPSCSGTARRMLRGNRLVDPIVRRVQYAAAIHERCLTTVKEYLANTQLETLAAMMVLPKPRYSSFSSIDSGSTATIQPPSKTPAACPLPVHPLLSVLPAANGLGALRNKRKAQKDVEASPRVKRRKMTHEDVGFAPINFAPPPASGADSSTVVGDTHSSASYTAAAPRYVPRTPLAGAVVPRSPANLDTLRAEPPVVSSPKRRKLF
ncbi:hypothetical protein GGH94_000531 [Coemansia aciculifera]|uniref:Fungal-type protein kinase domain-containing protein n=1 Tax=Coemansia aciculifera TaxID=417176 RepID=A0A9W8IN25_9FUNG|nr:hypothetical protein GGH94_000531 [Coemansia aciculifera]KAJ2876837.1 hypothetical protein GGH93_000430 [Coemansia aciculifera]